MFTFSEMLALALVQSESSFGAFVFHRRLAGLQATSDLVTSPIRSERIVEYYLKMAGATRSKRRALQH